MSEQITKEQREEAKRQAFEFLGHLKITPEMFYNFSKEEFKNNLAAKMGVFEEEWVDKAYSIYVEFQSKRKFTQSFND